MSKRVVSYKEKLVRVPAQVEYSCDTCGRIFKKGERKVKHFVAGGRLYACYDKPCSPFSKPKGYENVWSLEEQKYIWAKTPKPQQGEK